MIPPAVTTELDELEKNGYKASAKPGGDGLVHLIIEGFTLPNGYNCTETRLLIKLPAAYPNGNPDMFWVDEGLRLANGNLPDRANQEAVNGTTWLRFSWHPSKWNPGGDNLLTYIEFVNRRLQLKK